MIEYHIRQRIPALHHACDNDDMWFARTTVCIRNGYCAATDAHIVVHVPATEVFGPEIAAELEGKLIDGASWKTLHELSKRDLGVTIRYESDRIFMKVNEFSETVSLVMNSTHPKWAKFPNWERVWNDSVALEHEPAELIGINPRLMNKMAKAMNMPVSLHLTIKASSRGILVAPSDEYENVRAMIMPTIVRDALYMSQSNKKQTHKPITITTNEQA